MTLPCKIPAGMSGFISFHFLRMQKISRWEPIISHFRRKVFHRSECIFFTFGAVDFDVIRCYDVFGVICLKIRCIWEHNGNDSLLYAENFAGAFARGENLEAAKGKMEQEISSYLNWTGETGRLSPLAIEIVQEKSSELAICDADSDVLFDREREPLSMEEYMALKHLVLKSAQDFHALYMSVPDRNRSCIPARRTFYGEIPRTAEEMYRHTKSVNAYYFAEIGVDADNDGTIYECRERGFDQLEQIPDFLQNKVYIGSYDEAWSLRKVMRRFLWHDRIHAKAMYRMAFKTFGKSAVLNIFHFSV